MIKNRMRRFGVFIGTWNTSGEVFATELSPAATLTATDTYRWLPGRHFILHEADARFGTHATRSLEVFGYDRANRKYLSRSYDDQGGSEVFEVMLTGRRWRILGGKVRFDGRFTPGRDALHGLWEIRSKSGWRPWIRISLARAD
jgi:hypothetical protein